MSVKNAYPVRCLLPETFILPIKLLGTGADEVTISEGSAFITSVTRTGAGAHTIIFNDLYQALQVAAVGFQASTPGDMAGHTCVVDDLATNNTLPFVVYDSAFAADDLEANEYLTLLVVMRNTSLTK
jgi:hypothetical protein